MFKETQVEDIAEYASDAITIQKPQGAAYSVGAVVGHTIPAKWWNWLFRGATKILRQIYNDTIGISKDLQNLISYNGITLTDSLNAQAAQALYNLASADVLRYLRNKSAFLSNLALRTFRTDNPTEPVIPTTLEVGGITVLRDIGGGYFVIKYRDNLYFTSDLVSCYKSDMPQDTVPAWTMDYTFCNSVESRPRFFAVKVTTDPAVSGRYIFQLNRRNNPLDSSSEVALTYNYISSDVSYVQQTALGKFGTSYTFYMRPDGHCVVYDVDDSTHGFNVYKYGWTPVGISLNRLQTPVEILSVELQYNVWLLGNIKVTRIDSQFRAEAVFAGFSTENNVYDLINIKPVKLESGAVAFTFNWHSLSEEEAMAAGVVMLPDNTLQNPPQGLQFIPAQYQNVPGAVLAMGAVTGTHCDCYFSYDGINFEKLPVSPIKIYQNSILDVHVVCSNNLIIITEAFVSSSSTAPSDNEYKLYSIAPKLSAALSDYALLYRTRATLPYSSSRILFIADTGSCIYGNLVTNDLFRTVSALHTEDVPLPYQPTLRLTDNAGNKATGVLTRNYVNPWLIKDNNVYLCCWLINAMVAMISAKPVSNYTLYM